MFFSDELLTGRKGSLGVIWLMATLGPRSKRVSRKALTDVDLSRSCEIIAQPPEPMALRLSGSLLVGVARVYGQKYDMFCADVQSFDASLRRSIVAEVGGSEATRGGKRSDGGIDLPGGGKSRFEQITFEEAPFDTISPLDFEFAQIDWSNPLLPFRQRRATSKLSSQVTDFSVQENEEDELDDDIEMEVGRKRNRSATPLHQRISSIRAPSSDRFDPYIDEMNQTFEPVFLDILDDPSDRTAGGNGFEPFQDELINPLGELPAGEDVTMGDNNASNTNMGKRKDRHRSSGSATDVEDELENEPPAKKTKKRHLKTLTFDDNLEMISSGNDDYLQAMMQQRQYLVDKKDGQAAQSKAGPMVDGAGGWVEFFDSHMQEIFSSLSNPGQFRWEIAVQDRRRGKRPVAPSGQSAAVVPLSEPYNPIDYDSMPDLSNVPDMGELMWSFDNEPEVPRQQAESNGLPWEASSFSDPNELLSLGPSPGSRRLSIMTDQERFLRGSSQREASLLGGSRVGTPFRRHTRSRSASLLSIGHDHDQDLSLLDLPGLDEHDGLDAFSPAMLASLETQCRRFFTFVETEIHKQQVDEIGFSNLLPISDDQDARPTSKRVAAAAFYNCLNLATKRILNVKQASRFGAPITISIGAQ